MNNDFVTVAEAATLLGATREKVARLVRAGLLTSRPSVLDARRRLISRAEVEKLLAADGRGDAPAVPEPAEPSTRLRPRTTGIYSGPLEVRAAEVEEFLQREWHSK